MDIDLGADRRHGSRAEIILRRPRHAHRNILSSHTEPEIVARTEKITSYGFICRRTPAKRYSRR
ncbi:MAG: hypothetical protein MZV63_33520 [Marinilabiliales bacterium]|nr:hypothetical protein [Marinilabiliales bacterium]